LAGDGKNALVTTRLDHLSPPRPYAARAGIIAAWATTCVVVAWLDTRYGTKAVAGTTAGAGLLLLVRVRAYGVLLGLALVGCLNGVPGVDVNPGSNSISHTQDVFALAIVGGSLYVAASHRVQQRSQVQRALYVVCSLLFIWWTITWARTAIFGVVPASLAARFARDFAYFAITLPLLCDVFVTYPRLRRQLLWTMGVFGSVFAAAQIVRSQTHVDLNFILHSSLLTNVDGTTRVYSSMTMLVRAAFALSLGALIVGPTPRARRWAIAPTVFFGISMVLQLTRAAYFGAAAGFLVAGAIWWFRRSTERNVARKQLILVPILVAFLVGATSAVSAGERDLISKVTTRAFAGYSDVSNTSGTVAVRTHVASEMLTVLGGAWPIGLGFQHPDAHPYRTLPNGSIRDPDLGVLNAVMLMGVIGAILVYLPLLVVLRALTRRSGESRAGPGVEWLRLGGTIWIIGVLASSITLVELFSFGGLELSATMLALAASVAIPRTTGGAPST
jgi:hypothetical protein